MHWTEYVTRNKKKSEGVKGYDKDRKIKEILKKIKYMIQESKRKNMILNETNNADPAKNICMVLFRHYKNIGMHTTATCDRVVLVGFVDTFFLPKIFWLEWSCVFNIWTWTINY